MNWPSSADTWTSRRMISNEETFFSFFFVLVVALVLPVHVVFGVFVVFVFGVFFLLIWISLSWVPCGARVYSP
jgi:hypothetical protein